MENTGVYRVKRPWIITELVSISLLMGLQISSLSRLYRLGDNKLSLVLASSVVIFMFIYVIILIYRLFMTKRYIEIQIKPDSILIGDTIVEAKNVKILYIRGYFKPVVGVKPIARKFVPYKLCFSFIEQEDKGMKELKKWAEENQIKLLHKNFSRWL